jgi:hypothetical protein
MLSRIHGFPEGVTEPFWHFPDDSQLKAHPTYAAAKAGDMAAAVQVISDLAFPLLIRVRRQFSAGVCFVAPHAREASGDNAIPQVLAQACAMVGAGEADTDIVQAKSNPVTAMKSNKSLGSSPLPSPPTKPTTSLASARLTRSEIDSLRQGKKQIADYAQKALKDRVDAALDLPL